LRVQQARNACPRSSSGNARSVSTSEGEKKRSAIPSLLKSDPRSSTSTPNCELELNAPRQARDAYQRALELDPSHAGARVNLGRLLHEDGHPLAAANQYLFALTARPNDPIAAFNLGVALEDLGRVTEAITAYEQAIAADPAAADAHFNLAGLYEKEGKAAGAIRHLKAYRKLTQGR